VHKLRAGITAAIRAARDAGKDRAG
jgi:hypothetical protein